MQIIFTEKTGREQVKIVIKNDILTRKKFFKYSQKIFVYGTFNRYNFCKIIYAFPWIRFIFFYYRMNSENKEIKKKLVLQRKFFSDDDDILY